MKEKKENNSNTFGHLKIDNQKIDQWKIDNRKLIKVKIPPQST